MSDTLNGRFAVVAAAIDERVRGQHEVIMKLLAAVLADGHVLLEGPPGVAKTRAALLLAHAFHGSFARIQFTPDLLPGDLTGTSVFDAVKQQFYFHKGPLFHDFILADEINRAPAKVQAALLEAMAERQITAGGQTHSLDDFFFVIATQNPVEEEGTYELPIAQLDRFALCVRIGYPSVDAETQVLELVFAERRTGRASLAPLADLPQIGRHDLRAARREVLEVHVSAPLRNYMVRLVAATRDTGRRDGMIAHAVSPRGTLALAHLSCARAWLAGRDHVLPDDVQALARDVLAHRLMLTSRALMAGNDADHVIDQIVASVPVP